MNTLFAETLRKLRKEKGLSQIQLGKQMFVNNSTITRWETEASGFMVKPLTAEGVRKQLGRLRHPFSLGGAGE